MSHGGARRRLGQARQGWRGCAARGGAAVSDGVVGPRARLGDQRSGRSSAAIGVESASQFSILLVTLVWSAVSVHSALSGLVVVPILSSRSPSQTGDTRCPEPESSANGESRSLFPYRTGELSLPLWRMLTSLHARVFGSAVASRCASQFAAAIAALLIGLALAGPAAAQDLPGFGAGGEALGGLGRNAILLVGGLTLLSLAPGLAIMVTCFPFVVTVLSILRQSIGLQQSPPNMLIVSLAIFLSWYVMDPVLRDAWQVAGAPLQRGEITLPVAFERGVEPFRRFMAERIDPDTMAALADVAPTPAGAAPVTDDPQTAPLSLIVPSFMLSEIQKAFAIGFLVSLPFLIIDLVVSAILMSMGMMMVPPTVVALPFKLAFFVAVDGWGLLASALVRGYQGGG